MKKTILLTALGLTLSLSGFCQKEDVIDLSNMIVPMPTAIDYIGYEYYDVGIEGDGYQCYPPFHLTNIGIGSIQKGLPALPQNVTHFITAIEFIFGINKSQPNNPVFDLYARPIYLTYNDTSNRNVQAYNYYVYQLPNKIQFNNYYFVNSDGSVTLVSDSANSQMDVETTTYEDSLFIHHSLGDVATGFNSQDDPTEVIYSFQELDTVLASNKVKDLYLYIIGHPISTVVNNQEIDPIIHFDLMIVPNVLSLIKIIKTAISNLQQNDTTLFSYEIKRKYSSLRNWKQLSQLIPPNKVVDLGSLCPPECPKGCSDGTDGTCNSNVGYYLINPIQ